MSFSYPVPGFGNFQFDRAQQINELLVSVPSCRAVNRDRSLLEVPVRLSNGASTALRVNIPPGFPQEKPALSVTGPLRHPWVDGIGRLSFPALDRWNGATTRLAAVVTEARQGLSSATAGPAQQPAGSGPPQQQHAAPAGPAGGPQPAPGAAGQPPASPQRPRLPPPRAEFPELEGMSNGDLAAALTSEAAYVQLVQRVLAGGEPGAQQADEVLKRLRAEAEEQARRNLSREGEMAEIRNQIAIIRSSEYAPALAAYEEKAQKQQAVLDLLSPKVLVQKLQSAAQQADEQSDKLYKQLQAGEVPLEAFVQRYVEARAVFHQRDLKAQAALHTIPMDV